MIKLEPSAKAAAGLYPVVKISRKALLVPKLARDTIHGFIEA